MNLTVSTTPVALPEGHREILRVVFPEVNSPETIALYAENGANQGPVEVSENPKLADSPRYARAEIDHSLEYSRTSVKVEPGKYLSLGTYFNAFPASYWRRWTPVREVTLSIATRGEGTIVVYRSNAKGVAQAVETVRCTGETEKAIALSLTPFGDGGWYWFDAYAGEEAFEVLSARYSAHESLARCKGTFSIAMTTMNKVEYCLENIRSVSQNADILDLLDTMFVVDQGSDRLSDHPEDLAPLKEAMDGKLTIIEQGNIGGSGGFSRGMYESAQNTDSTYVINCDDDINLEPETLRRLVTFADFASRPTLVGAHMFDLNNRSVLHAFGESVNRYRMFWGPSHPALKMGHDLASKPLRQTPWLHRRVDVDYNGWWTCLIPTEVVREIGLSLPIFIKWDDAEYGLRAQAAGYPTVSLPGAGVWHVSWGDKDDSVGWQAFFHERNRLVAALLYSPYERGGRVLRESHFMDVKHVIAMQYYTQAIRLIAQRDVLDGPDSLHAKIGVALPEIRSVASEFGDAEMGTDVESFPGVKAVKPPNQGRPLHQPSKFKLPVWAGRQILRQFTSEPADDAKNHPQVVMPHQDAKWWSLAYYDSALVSNAEGTAMSWHKRDPKTARAMILEAIQTHAKLLSSWKNLSRDYREALPRITSFEEWEKTFAANPAPTRESKGK